MTESLPAWLMHSTAIIGIICLGIYAIYRRAIRRPIPGIPHHEDSATRFTGDGPYFLALEAAGKRPRDFWANLCVEKQSPIVQFFPGPFFKPIVIISDFREAQDLLTRRAKEIDRAYISKIMWSGVVSHHFVALDSKDKRYPESKQLVRDIMGPTYIQTVATPVAYSNVSNLVELWKFKAQVAQGRPFKAIADLAVMTGDTIFESGMGITGTDRNQVQNLEKLKSEDLEVLKAGSGQDSKAFPFPEYPTRGLLRTIDVIAEVTGKFPTAPVIHLHWPINNLRSSVRKAKSDKRRLIDEQIDKAVRRWEMEGAPKPYTNALQYMIYREYEAAKKAGRTPNFKSPLFLDGLYGYCFGGQDTTHSALSFLVKYFGAYPHVQTKLRTALRTAHAEGRLPTGPEIMNTKIPYLDAFMEEVLRLNASASAVLKEAQSDMVILGHHIPAGTQLLIPLWGPSINSPSIPVPDSVRSESAQKHADFMRTDWGTSEYPASEFVPERWLKQEDGKVVFDPKAGPQLTFSLGPRECWGRKLAYLQVRILTTLLVLNFEFLPLPEELVNWEVKDILNAKPKICLVRLKPL